MTKPKNKTAKGKRINIWLAGEELKRWEQIENKSKFVQLCLRDVVGIMTWAILIEEHPEKYRKNTKPMEEVLPEYNKKFPLNQMTKTRLKIKTSETDTWQDNSPSEQELW